MITRDTIAALADSVGYVYDKPGMDWLPGWLDYSESVAADPTVTVDQIREELEEFKRIEEEHNNNM